MVTVGDAGCERHHRSGHAGFLEFPELFDAELFGISKSEAERMDPHHRHVLEVVHEVLSSDILCSENSSYLKGSRTGTLDHMQETGVFVGLDRRDWALLGCFGDSSGEDLTFMAANRVSYAFGLRGPSLVVDTASSSSLVAVELAKRQLL